MVDEKPPALCVYDIPFPRARCRTCPAVDFELWKARHSLLADEDAHLSTIKPMSSEANSLAGSWETLSECESFPPALCVYDIPLPCGHFRSWEKVCSVGKETPPLTRKRSVTLPATDLKTLRLKKILSKREQTFADAKNRSRVSLNHSIHTSHLVCEFTVLFLP